MKRLRLIKKDQKYKWGFSNVGGVPRVKITTGEDIAHLDELDPKMWTVLSCPVKGLVISDRSLGYIDVDGDGKIRVNDVVATSQWLTSVLKDNDLILASADSVDVEQINQEMKQDANCMHLQSKFWQISAKRVMLLRLQISPMSQQSLPRPVSMVMA